MNEEIKKIRDYIKCPQFGDIEYGKWGALNLEQRIKIKKMLDYIADLQEKNQKLNKIIDEFEKWLKETKKFNYGFKIKSEYIYTYEFVCKNILNKLTELKNEVE